MFPFIIPYISPFKEFILELISGLGFRADGSPNMCALKGCMVQRDVETVNSCVLGRLGVWGFKDLGFEGLGFKVFFVKRSF